MKRKPDFHTEGEANTSSARHGWLAKSIGPNSRPPLKRDANAFWQAVRQACTEAGALLISDETPTGLGKTGKFVAFVRDAVEPDIVVLGKALGGGVLPIAAVIANTALDVCSDFAIDHYTHEKNPVTARAALTTLQIIEDEGLFEKFARFGEHALNRLKAFAQSSSMSGEGA